MFCWIVALIIAVFALSLDRVVENSCFGIDNIFQAFRKRYD